MCILRNLMLLLAATLTSAAFPPESKAQTFPAGPFPARLENAIDRTTPSRTLRNTREIVPNGIQSRDLPVATGQAKSGSQDAHRTLKSNPPPVAKPSSKFVRRFPVPARLSGHKTSENGPSIRNPFAPPLHANKKKSTSPDQANPGRTDDDVSWFGTVMTFPAGNGPSENKNIQGKANIVIHPPQPTGSHRYMFEVENVGLGPAPRFTVEIASFPDTRIDQVIPYTGVSHPHLALVEIPQLAAGKTSQIHVHVSEPQQAEFATRIRVARNLIGQFHATPVEPLACTSRESDQKSGSSNTPHPRTPFRLVSTPQQIVGATQNGNSTTNRPSSLSDSNVSIDSRILVSLRGDENGPLEQMKTFEISIANSSNQIVKDVIVQLNLPAEMKMTWIEREAWVNQKRGTVSWKFDSIPPGKIRRVRYSIVPTAAGNWKQSVTVGASQRLEDSVEMVYKVNP